MTEIKIENASFFENLKDVFRNMSDGLLRSYFDGCIGSGWSDNAENPTCGKIIVGDFCHLAGDYTSKEAYQLLANMPDDCILASDSDGWRELTDSVYGEKCRRAIRYAFKRDVNCFDRQKLKGYLNSLPEKYTIQRIDEKLYHRTLTNSVTWSFCSNYKTAEDFLRDGLGYCIFDGDEIIGGASSYVHYSDGIEIQIDTHPDYQRQGIATAVASRIILECLENNKYPYWDAHSEISRDLAVKLGYIVSHEYISHQIAFKK